MDIQEFNALLKLMKTNADAAYKISKYCVSRIKGRLKTKGVNKQDLEDISHTVFMQIYNKPPEYIYAPYKYLCKVTDNYLINIGIKQAREREIFEDIALDSKEVKNIPCEFTFNEGENEVLETVNDTDEEIITMHVVEGFTHKYISKKLNMSYDAVRARYSRAMRKLKEKLKDRHNKKQ